MWYVNSLEIWYKITDPFLRNVPDEFESEFWILSAVRIITKLNKSPPFRDFIDANCSRQNWAAEYWVSQGAPSDKLVIGMPAYGHCFTLSNPAAASGIGDPTSGGCPAGTYTASAGFLAYYEVCYNRKNLRAGCTYAGLELTLWIAWGIL